MGELDKIGLKFGTDKASKYHNYLNLYEKYLSPIRKSAITFVEIGVFNGKSMKMWEQYFNNPVSKLYGIDNIESHRYTSDRAETFIGQQEDRAFLGTVFNKIGLADIIIDDGSHIISHQQIALGFLFPFVKSGGLYVIEDLHTSNHPTKSARFNPTKTKKTTLNVLKNLRDLGTIDSDFILDSEARYVEQNIKSCIIETPKICFIRKK